MKVSFLILFLNLIIFSSCNEKKDVYQTLLIEELNDSDKFLNNEINNQESFITSKINDYPYLNTSYDTLEISKIEIKNFCKLNSLTQKDTLSIAKFKNQIENKTNLRFKYNSLNIKSKIEDSIFRKIVINDFLNAKFELNDAYIKVHCSIIE